jgi:exodeoxyribonuclease VII small subunit
MENKLTYEQAMQRLETMLAQLENNEVNLDDLGNCVREAQQLLKYCKECLYEVEKVTSTLRDVSEKE